MASSFGKRIKHLAKKAIGKSKTTYDRYRFLSEEAKKKYLEQYSRKAVVIKHFIDFNDSALCGLSIIQELERCGRQTFLSQKGQVYEDIMCEFCSNLNNIDFYPDGPHILSKLHARIYIIGPTHFSTILDLLVVEDPKCHYGDEYESANLVPLISSNNTPWNAVTYPQQELKHEYRVLNIVPASSLIPQKRTSNLTIERATLLATIMTGKTICARCLIGEVMNSHLTNVHNPATLPFALFITKCARLDGIRITTNNKMLSQEKAIDENTLNQFTAQRKRRKTAEKMMASEDTTGGSSSMNLSERLDALTLTIEQKRQANADWRECHQQSMEQEHAAATSWREYQRHSIDIMQSEVHQMYYNQQ